jgi:hypothetical protein
MYTRKSRSSILRIRRKHRERNATNPTQLLKSPGKKRGKHSRDVVFVDEFDKCVIRNTIQELYIQGKNVPTLPKLLPIIKQKILFHWRRKSLERIVKSLGFKWRKCQSKRKIQIERADNVDWKSRYLVKIKEYCQ